MEELLKVVEIDVSKGIQSVQEYADSLDKASESANNLNSNLESVEQFTNVEMKTDFLNGISEGLDDIVQQFNGDYEPAVTALIEQMKTLVGETDDLKTSADSSIGPYIDYLDKAAASAHNLDAVLDDVADDTNENIKTEFLAGLSEGIDDVARKFNGDYKPAVEGMIEQMQKLNVATAKLDDEVEDSVDDSIGWFDKLKNMVKSVKKETDDVGVSAGDLGKQIAKVGENGTESFEAIRSAMDLAELGPYGEKLGNIRDLLKQTGIVGAAGFNKIKLAIAGTGIGLIIIAIGTLIARFDDLKKAIGLADYSMEDFKKIGIDALKTVTGYVVGFGSAVYGSISGSIKGAIALFTSFKNNAIQMMKTTIEAIKAGPTGFINTMTNAFSSFVSGTKKAVSDAGKIITTEVSTQWSKGVQSGQKLITNIFAPDTEEVKTKTKEASSVVKEAHKETVDSTTALNRELLDNTLKRIEEETKYQKEWIEASLLSEEEKKQKIFELEQAGYQERLDAYNEFISTHNLNAQDKANIEVEIEKTKNQAILEDYAYTNQLMQEQEEAEKIKKQEDLAAEREEMISKRDYDIEMAELTISDEQVLQDRIYEIKVEALQKEEALLQKQLSDESINAKEREKIEKNLALVKAKLSNEEQKQQEKIQKQDLARRKLTASQTLNVTSNLFGSLSQLAGKNSAAGKAMSVAQTTISTYQSATEAYKAMAGIPVVGPALGVAAAAAAVASGLANIKEILSVDEQGETTAPTATTVAESAPTQTTSTSVMPQQVAVTPMLDELRDITNMQTLPITSESSSRVYVVESDINEVGTRVEVRESEATF